MAGAPKGNANSAKGRMWAHALEMTAAKRPKDLLKIAEKVFDMAMEGDMQAIKEIGDRFDGKPKQQTEITAELDHRYVISDTPIQSAASWLEQNKPQ